MEPSTGLHAVWGLDFGEGTSLVWFYLLLLKSSVKKALERVGTVIRTSEIKSLR